MSKVCAICEKDGLFTVTCPTKTCDVVVCNGCCLHGVKDNVTCKCGTVIHVMEMFDLAYPASYYFDEALQDKFMEYLTEERELDKETALHVIYAYGHYIDLRVTSKKCGLG